MSESAPVGGAWAGTVWLNTGLIMPTDPTTFKTLTYSGMQTRTIFDGRHGSWTTAKRHVYRLHFDDGVVNEAVVNAELNCSTTREGRLGALAHSFGQLPHILRSGVDQIWIHPAGNGTEVSWGGNRFTRSVDVYTNVGAIGVGNEDATEELLVHESAHAVIDSLCVHSPFWLMAQQRDAGFVSAYAKKFADREDPAESFLAWLMTKRGGRVPTSTLAGISGKIPNRLRFFDSFEFNLHPYSNI